MSHSHKHQKNPWQWIPSLYYAEGIPYIIVMTVSVILYKRLGVSNTEIALYTSWLYLPWTIKPLWSPVVDLFRTKRAWIVAMQLLIGAGLAGVALTIPVPGFFQYTLMFFWLLAFSSATHDIAADGFYMLGLSENEQAYFVGIRSTFYRLAMITGQGLLIILAGYIESRTGLPDLEIQVHANPAAHKQELQPESAPVQSIDETLRIVTTSETLTIPLTPVQQEEVAAMLAETKAWNISRGFYREEKKQEQRQSSGVSFTALENFIQSHFGTVKPPVDHEKQVGNTGSLSFHLSQSPGEEEITVDFGRQSGDKSIQLIEGTRFTFNKSNWDQPAIAVFQLDSKLKTSSTAVFKARSGNVKLAWVITFSILAFLFFVFFLYHRTALPLPANDKPSNSAGNQPFMREFLHTFVLFFKKKHIGLAITFLLVYRLGESQLVKMASPFLLDAREIGGLGLTTGQVGLVYGTVGIIALTLGGILGGLVASRHGLKKWILWMLIAINLPNSVYIYLSYALPESFLLINTAVAIEQFGYGFGFTAYMLYMIYISDGEHKTAHFAMTTAFMALGMMIPGMLSGWLQELIGYRHFFIWVMIATIPAFLVTPFLPIDKTFGVKEK
ncbi:MAG: MFS transporter [Acidobacteria bacterium]|nr:MAG: MFS transporter [Acidobacteriota bacterium]